MKSINIRLLSIVLALTLYGCVNNVSPTYVNCWPNESSVLRKQVINSIGNHTFSSVKYGTLAAGINVRSSPPLSGRLGNKIASTNVSSAVTITAEQNGWYQISTKINGISRQGWVKKNLIRVNSHKVAKQNPNNLNTILNAKQEIRYSGFSSEFVPIKQRMVQGRVNEVSACFATPEKITEDDNEFLDNLIRGSLSLDLAETDNAINHFSNAEEILIGREDEPIVKEVVSGFVNEMFSTLTGIGEGFSSYKGVGYERVLMLNYKAMAYLLQGERKAFNVNKRAILWQDLERELFEEKFDAATEELNGQIGKNGSMLFLQEIENLLLSQYRKEDNRIKNVKSAYLNPFGYYLSGAILELDSYRDSSLRSNARIAYSKAKKLVPSSRVINQAVKDLRKSRAPRNKRLLHIIVGEGFVPEKRLLTNEFSLANKNITIQLPIYQSIKSKVHKIKVKSKNMTLAVLSDVANIEAISLKHQQSLVPLQLLKASTGIAREMFISQGLDMMTQSVNSTYASSYNNTAVTDLANKGADGIKKGYESVKQSILDFKSEIMTPDMRSWMSLPAKMKAARIFIPKHLKQVRIVSYDRNGKQLASKKVALNTQSHNFVYARSIDQNLYVHPSKKLWVTVN